MRFIFLFILTILITAGVESAERLSVRFARLNREASVAKANGEYAQALKLYNEALSIPASKTNLATVSLNKSDLLIQTGQYADAEELLKSLQTDSKVLELRRLSNLSSLYAQTKREEEAVEIYSKLLSTDIANRDKGLITQNFGFLRMLQGEWDEAVKQYRSACAILVEDSMAYPIVLANLALAECYAGNAERSIEDISQAIKLFDRYFEAGHPDRMTAIRKEGEIYLKSGKLEEAKEAFAKYYTGERSNVLANFEKMGVQQRLDYWKKEKDALSIMFGLEEYAPDFLLDISIFRRNISLLGNGVDVNKYLKVCGKELRNKLRSNEAVVDFVVYPKRIDRGLPEEFIGALIVTSEKVEFVSLGSMKALKGYRIKGEELGKAVSTNNSEMLNSLYSDKELSNRIWGKILDKIGAKSMIYFVPDGIINNLGVENLAGVPGDKQFIRITSPVMLIDRLKNNQGQKQRTPSLLLAGGLDYNMEMQTGKSGTPGDHRASEFLRNRYGEVYFDNLPGSRKEIDFISSTYPTAEKRYQLDEKELPSLLKKFNRVHIATHGYAVHEEEDNKNVISDSLRIDNSLLTCGLVLSGANRSYKDSLNADGLLSAREICDYDLSNIDFFVLSACRTADGDATDEGPAGLIRGLKKAGVKSILASLWEVDDEATSIFMQKFYALINKGMSVRDAFTAARDYLRGYEMKYPEVEEEFNPSTMTTEYVETGRMVSEYPYAAPAIWAPFVLIDNL